MQVEAEQRADPRARRGRRIERDHAARRDRATRRSSTEDASMSGTLRSRKPETIASKAAAAKGRRAASPTTQCTRDPCGRRRPNRIISGVKSSAMRHASGWRCSSTSKARSPVPAPRSSTRGADGRSSWRSGLLPPATVLAEGHQPVEQVVARGDAPEHVAHVACPGFAGQIAHSARPKRATASGTYGTLESGAPAYTTSRSTRKVKDGAGRKASSCRPIPSSE